MMIMDGKGIWKKMDFYRKKTETIFDISEREKKMKFFLNKEKILFILEMDQ